jgi:starch synthase (maltosyl-transferring)
MNKKTANNAHQELNHQSVVRVVAEGRQRVVVDEVRPVVDGGRFAIKRVEGEQVVVEADIFADGHDELSALLLYRQGEQGSWVEVPMEPAVNDVWRAAFYVNGLGDYYYTVQAWVDRFRSWRGAMAKKLAVQQDVGVDRLIGAELVSEGAGRATGGDRRLLKSFAEGLRGDSDDVSDLALADELAELMAKYPDRRWAVTFDKELRVSVERQKARYSAWYEMFPRSCAATAGAHGTFKDCIAWLPYVASMGFDVLYLPPIHPVGISFRKGKNNSTYAEADDVGSPWAIGAKEGGHKAIHPRLGTLDDFKLFADAAKEHGLEIALDIAFQCTPDHPYVRDHPEWFRKRPDGTIQYAENPPKKYQDIYPIDFESDDWEALWHELKSVIDYWCEQGVRIFRIDNPHTKAIPFWQWVIGAVKKAYPDTIFLAEAFTRPKVMYRLAKVGFSQSYTYFAWRNTKSELTEYFTELTQTDVKEYFRPNLWPNTPDILTEYLQFGGRPAFMARLVLASTLGANYGIYGPAYELCENVAREPGSEEYLDSEKYQIKLWDIARSDSLKELIGRMNRIRRENRALHNDGSLRFHSVDNDEILCFSKQTDDLENVIVVVVNLDPHHSQSGWVELSTKELGLDPREPYQMHELLTGARYLWHGARNYVQIDPQSVPAQIFHMRPKLRREQDFDYFF